MRFVLTLVPTLVWACVPAEVPSAPSAPRQAWFYSTTTLRASTAPVLWCSFVTEANAKAAENSERFEPVESGWLRYRGNTIEILKVMSQSEDAYVEDTYTLGPHLAVRKVVRRGHYVSDPFVTATFRPDGSGHLQMTAESRHALESWKHTSYFLEWPLYATFSEIPFAGLIDVKPSISVSEACLERKS
jgi:hypothetical protein